MTDWQDVINLLELAKLNWEICTNYLEEAEAELSEVRKRMEECEELFG